MIYIVSHRKAELPTLEGYVPIQVGASEAFFPGGLRDDIGDNISEKNPNYCELTALYWVWKNTDDDYKGIAHYRRYFGRRPFSSSFRDICGYRELTLKLRRCDILVARPACYHVSAREQLLMECCTPDVFEKLEDTVKRLQPGYVKVFETFFSGNRASQYNMMFCRGELFDAYCAWLFPMLFHLEARVDLTEANDYQKRLYGFLSERLLNVWIAGNALRAECLPIVSTSYALRDHLTYFRRDITNELRFMAGRLLGKANG